MNRNITSDMDIFIKNNLYITNLTIWDPNSSVSLVSLDARGINTREIQAEIT